MVKRKTVKKITPKEIPLYYQDLTGLVGVSSEDEFYMDVFISQNTQSIRPVMGGISIRTPEEFALFNMPQVKSVTRIFMYQGLGDELDVVI